ncbi:MAG TPA: potassium channel family protein [Terriglobales bacterium]|nr:potassium channel family protein [Terriglobales bacterium]
MLYKRPDLYLLLSLLLFILLHPVLVHGLLWRLILGMLMFVPVVLATVRVSEIKGWLWPTVLLGSGVFIFTLANAFFPNRALEGIKWAIMTAFCGLAVVVLFSFFKSGRAVHNAHLCTAVSIYLLLGLLWFALYSAIEAFYPGSILRTSTAMADRSTELLYFSLVTLSTIGYGDVVPLNPEVRILAALEGITGVLYIAITVALLVSAYKREGTSREP